MDAGGVELSTKRILIDDLRVNLMLFNIPSDLSDELKHKYYRRVRHWQAAIILFDKQDLDSFTIAGWEASEFRKKYHSLSFPLVLVGIQSEIEVITTDQGQDLARCSVPPMYYWETPINDPLQIAHLMTELIRLCSDT
jgi:hypothetical protein